MSAVASIQITNSPVISEADAIRSKFNVNFDLVEQAIGKYFVPMTLDVVPYNEGVNYIINGNTRFRKSIKVECGQCTCTDCYDTGNVVDFYIHDEHDTFIKEDSFSGVWSVEKILQLLERNFA